MELLGRWTVSILAQCVMGADRSSGVIPANISLVIPHQSGARSHTVNTSKSPSSPQENILQPPSSLSWACNILLPILSISVYPFSYICLPLSLISVCSVSFIYPGHIILLGVLHSVLRGGLLPGHPGPSHRPDVCL